MNSSSVEAVEARTPETSPARLLSLAESCPLDVLQNPALPIIALEDPALFSRLLYVASKHSLFFLMRQRAEAHLAALPRLPSEADLCLFLEGLRPELQHQLTAYAPLSLDPDGLEDAAPSSIAYSLHQERAEALLRAVPWAKRPALAARFLAEAWREVEVPFAGREFFAEALAVLLQRAEPAPHRHRKRGESRRALREVRRMTTLLRHQARRDELPLAPPMDAAFFVNCLERFDRALHDAFSGRLWECAERCAASIADLRSERDRIQEPGRDWSDSWDHHCAAAREGQLSSLFEVCLAG